MPNRRTVVPNTNQPIMYHIVLVISSIYEHYSNQKWAREESKNRNKYYSDQLKIQNNNVRRRSHFYLRWSQNINLSQVVCVSFCYLFIIIFFSSVFFCAICQLHVSMLDVAMNIFLFNVECLLVRSSLAGSLLLFFSFSLIVFVLFFNIFSSYELTVICKTSQR